MVEQIPENLVPYEEFAWRRERRRKGIKEKGPIAESDILRNVTIAQKGLHELFVETQKKTPSDIEMLQRLQDLLGKLALIRSDFFAHPEDSTSQFIKLIKEAQEMGFIETLKIKG